jgi:hypothetical protein
MIVRSTSNIDLIQGVVGYGDPEGITDWRITNTSGTFNILNSISQTSKLTILESGNVGISNINPGSLLDVGGDVNISGVYKKNNRDVINDTSNYVLSTSNNLANGTSSQWTNVSSGINYNTSNVGIGTTNPISKLHIYNDTISDTKLTIQNKTGSTGTYLIMAFRNRNTV